MARQRFTTEQIIHKLREADVLVGQGKTVVEACKQIGMTDRNYFRWRKSHGDCGSARPGCRSQSDVQSPQALSLLRDLPSQ